MGGLVAHTPRGIRIGRSRADQFNPKQARFPSRAPPAHSSPDPRDAPLPAVPDRTEVAGLVGRARHLRHAAAACEPQDVCARHVPLPQWRRAARGPPRGLHRHRHRGPVRADAGHDRDASDGLRRLWPACGGACDPHRHAAAGEHRAQHRHVPPSAEDARLQLRLEPFAGNDRPRIRPLDAVDFPPALRHLVRRRPAEGPADRRTADSRRGRRPR